MLLCLTLYYYHYCDILGNNIAEGLGQNLSLSICHVLCILHKMHYLVFYLFSMNPVKYMIRHSPNCKVTFETLLLVLFCGVIQMLYLALSFKSLTNVHSSILT